MDASLALQRIAIVAQKVATKLVRGSNGKAVDGIAEAVRVSTRRAGLARQCNLQIFAAAARARVDIATGRYVR